MDTARTVFQVVLLSALFVACDAWTKALGLPLPGSVVGVLVLFALLLLGVVKLRWVERGADLLLSAMALFFVPAVVASMRVVPGLKSSLPGIAVVMVVTTALVMAVTGVIAERLSRGKKP
jgi:holin-like protein